MEDTGIGLTRDQAGRLFQAFSQADTSTSRRYGGTGLGLMISRRLVQLMGGDIHLVSAPGQGTTFYFDIRMAYEAGDAVRSSTPADLIGQAVRVVDDHALAGEAIASALERMGLFAEVNIGLPPPDADGEFVENLIIDAELPGAREYIERLRMKSPEPGLPRVILLAGRDIDASQQAMEEWWADDCLSKPVTVVRLLRALAGERRAQPEVKNTYEDIRGHHVLVVDDVPVNRMILAEMLGDWGLDVDQAESAEQAIAMAGEKFYSAILMDVQMPGMDGTDATRRIRADGYAGPVVALTAHSLDAERERCRDAGMNDLVTKPVDPDRLAHVLRQTLPPLPAETAKKVMAQTAEALALASVLGASHLEPPGNASTPAQAWQRLSATDTGATERDNPGKIAVSPAPTCGANDSAESESGDGIDLTQLPGIDTERALQRMQGKRRLYIKVLHSFCERYGTADSTIATALAERRREDAEREAHSLRGLAANMGAEALSEAADALERAIREHQPTEWPLAALTLELAQVISGLKTALG